MKAGQAPPAKGRRPLDPWTACGWIGIRQLETPDLTAVSGEAQYHCDRTIFPGSLD